MSTITWKTGSSGTWSVGSNWAGGTAPASGDDVAISAAPATSGVPYIVDFASSAGVNSVTLNQALAELQIASSTLSVATSFALTAGTLDLDYGTLQGGTYISTVGTVLLSGYGTLSDLAWNGTLDLAVDPNYGYGYAYLNSVTFHGSNGSGAGSLAVGAGVVVYVEQASLDGAAASLSNGSTIYSLNDALTLGPAFTLQTGGVSNPGSYTAPAALIVGGNDLLANKGTIADTTGTTLTIEAGTFTNAGTLTVGAGSVVDITTTGTGAIVNSGRITIASGGILDITTAGTAGFTNSGTIIDAGGTLALDLSLTTAKLLTYPIASGTLALYGTLTNNSTLTLGSAGKIANLLLAGGEIIGGTIISPGNFTVGQGTGIPTLSNVTVHGLLSIGPPTYVYDTSSVDIINTLHMTGVKGTGAGTISIANGANLDFIGTQSLTNAAVAFGTASTTGSTSTSATLTAGSYGEASATTLTLGVGLILTQGATFDFFTAYTQNDLTINAGTIAADATFGTFTVTNFKNTGTLAITNGDNFNWYSFESAAGTIANTGRISVSNGTLGIGSNILANSGVISLSGTNSTVGNSFYYAGGASIQNSGSILLSNGTTLTVSYGNAGWTNTGTVQVNASELTLDGTFTTAQFGSIVLANGGMLGIGGTLTNSGTLAIGTGKSLSSVALVYGGDIVGGTIVDSGGGLLAQGGTLSGLAYHGALNLGPSNATLTVANGLTMAGANGSGLGTITSTGNLGALYVAGSQTISGAVIDFGYNVSGIGDDIYFTDVSAAATLTLAAGDKLVQTAIYGGIVGNVAYSGGIYGPSGDTLINKGSITETSAGSTLSLSAMALVNAGSILVAGGSVLAVNGSTLTNSGTLSLSGSNTSLGFGYDDYAAPAFINSGLLTIGTGALVSLNSLYNGWSNSGTIKVAGGTLSLAGTITSAQLGIVQSSEASTVDLGGTLANSGTLLVGSTVGISTLTLLSGSDIVGGTIKNAANGIVDVGGTLSGVSYDGSLSLAGSGARTTITNGLTMAGAAGTGTGTLLDTGPGSTLALAGTQNLAGATIDLGATPSNGYYYTSSLQISDMPSGAATITLGAASSLVQTGLEAVINGSVAYSGSAYGPTGDTLINKGSISETLANAFINDSDVDIINSGKMTIGNGAELLVQSGTVTNTTTLTIATASKTNQAAADLQFSAGGYAGSESFANTGLVVIGAGGELNLTDPDLAWSNSGTFQVSGGNLSLGGTFIGAQLGTVLVTGGGTVGIEGTLTNSGTLAVGTGTSLTALTLFTGGAIAGGTIDDAGGGIVADGGTLSAVTYQGTLNAGNGNGELTLVGGLSMTGANGSGPGTILLGEAGDTLQALGSQSVSNATIDLGQSGAVTLSLAEPASTAITLTLAASTALVQTGLSAIIAGTQSYNGSVYAPVGDTLVNDGAITDTVAASALQLQALDVDNAGQMTIGGGADMIEEGGTLTNTSTISISGTGTSAAGYVYNSLLLFEAGAAAPGFANSGLVSIGTGGVLQLDDGNTANPMNWANAGSIAVAGGTLELGGAFATAQIGKVTVTAGGQISVASDGVLDNSGATLTVGAASSLGTIALQGTIHGGTIIDHGNGILFEGSVNYQSGQNTVADLDMVKYEGPLDIVGAYEDLVITGGISLTGTAGTGAGSIVLTGAGAVLDFIGKQTLGSANISIGAASSGPTLTGTALTLGGTTTQIAATATIGSAGGSITTTGHIIGAQSGGTLTLAGSIANSGTIAISNGETLLLDTSALTNTGLISVTNGLLDVVNVTASQLSAITLTNSQLAVTGTLTASGSTLTVGSGTALPFIELAGTIMGGTIHDNGNGVGYYGNAILDGVSYQGTLSVARPLSSVTITGGFTATDSTGTHAGSIDLTGAGSALIWDSTQTLNNAMLNIGNAGNSYEGNPIDAPALTGGVGVNTVSLGSALTIDQTNTYANIGGTTEYSDYLFSASGSFTSAATINASFAGGSLQLEGYNFISTGSIAVSNGDTLTAASVNFTNAGLMTIGAGSALSLDLLNYFSANNFAPESFTNSGSIALSGGTLSELTDGGTFPAVPLLNSNGAHISGHGTLQSAIVNNGIIAAQGGTLVVSDPISGVGTLLVDAGATLSLSAVSGGETASFGGASGMLSLSPPSFLGTIGSFASGDTIDLQNTAATAAKFAASSLVVTLNNGSTIALATSTTLTGSLTVTVGTRGDSLISFSGAQLHANGTASPGQHLTLDAIAGYPYISTAPAGLVLPGPH